MAHNLEVVLVVTSPCVANPVNTKFLLLRSENGKLALPRREVGERESSLQCAASLLKELTGVQARILGHGWLDLKQCHLADNVNRVVAPMNPSGWEDINCLQRWIAVPYGCMLPGDVIKPLAANAGWLTFQEIVAEQPMYCDHMDILTAVANTL